MTNFSVSHADLPHIQEEAEVPSSPGLGDRQRTRTSTLAVSNTITPTIRRHSYRNTNNNTAASTPLGDHTSYTPTRFSPSFLPSGIRDRRASLPTNFFLVSPNITSTSDTSSGNIIGDGNISANTGGGSDNFNSSLNSNTTTTRDGTDSNGSNTVNNFGNNNSHTINSGDSSSSDTITSEDNNDSNSSRTVISSNSNNVNSTGNINNNTTVEQTEEGIMDENMRVEEKLRQFKNDSKKDDNEDTRGTYTPMSELEKQRRRNLIFDEERFEETFLKCLICREVYNEVDKLPKMLHCHHTFCLECLQQMYRVEGEFRQSLTGVFRGMPMTVKIQCPTCREGIIISESELRRLPNDHTIMELLSFVTKTGKNDVQYCTKHQMQPLNFFCEPCILPVCCDCTVIDHKESKGHIVVNVNDAMKTYTPIVEETLNDIRSEKVKLAEKREALENALEDLDKIQRSLNTQIRAVFDNIREILDEREKELYAVSDSEVDRKREVIDGHMKVLNDRESQLNSEFNDLQKAKDEKNISQLFTGHKSAREVLSKKIYVPTNSMGGFSLSFQFSSRAEALIKQNVANLGDIIFKS